MSAVLSNENMDQWVEITKDCKYLPETGLKQLCDLVIH